MDGGGIVDGAYNKSEWSGGVDDGARPAAGVATGALGHGHEDLIRDEVGRARLRSLSAVGMAAQFRAIPDTNRSAEERRAAVEALTRRPPDSLSNSQQRFVRVYESIACSKAAYAQASMQLSKFARNGRVMAPLKDLAESRVMVEGALDLVSAAWQSIHVTSSDNQSDIDWAVDGEYVKLCPIPTDVEGLLGLVKLDQEKPVLQPLRPGEFIVLLAHAHVLNLERSERGGSSLGLRANRHMYERGRLDSLSHSRRHRHRHRA